MGQILARAARNDDHVFAARVGHANQPYELIEQGKWSAWPRPEGRTAAGRPSAV